MNRIINFKLYGHIHHLIYHLFVIMVISSTLPKDCMAQDYKKIPLGAKLQKGRLALATESVDDAKSILVKLKETPGIQSWATLFLIEAQIIEGNYELAQKTTSEISVKTLTPFATLYYKKLELELMLLNQESIEYQKIYRSIKELSQKKSKLLTSELAYLSAVLQCRQDRYTPGVKALQNLRSKYPLSIAARKAYVYQNKILERNFGSKVTLLTPDFWLNEVKTLIAQRNYNAAEIIWTDKVAPKNIGGYNKSLFDIKLTLLKGAKEHTKLDKFLEDASAKGSPVRINALTEKVSVAWNKNNYQVVNQLLNEIGEIPYTIYMRGRIEEEQRNFATAKEHFNKLFQTAGHQYRFQAGTRLALLQIIDKETEKAGKILTQARKYNPRTNYYDSVGFEYLNHTTSPTVVKKSSLSFRNDPRLYYYWLLQGANITSPHQFRVTPKKTTLPTNSKCSDGPVYLESAERKHLRELASFGVSDILSEELKYTLRHEAKSLSEIKARAELISELGSPAEGIKELRTSEEDYARLEKECLGSLMKILYPKNFGEIFEKESKRTGVDKFLLMAITRVESAYDPLAISRSGAVGLMQLMPFTAEQEGFKGYANNAAETVFDPEINIALGANHLKRLLDKYGDDNWHLVVAAYNAGGNAVDRWLARYPKAPPEIFVELITFKETRNYVKKVLGAYWAYKVTEG